MDEYWKRTKSYFYPPEVEKTRSEKMADYFKSYFIEPPKEKSYYEKTMEYAKSYVPSSESVQLTTKSCFETAKEAVVKSGWEYFKPKTASIKQDAAVVDERSYYQRATDSAKSYFIKPPKEKSYYEKTMEYAKSYVPSSESVQLTTKSCFETAKEAVVKRGWEYFKPKTASIERDAAVVDERSYYQRATDSAKRFFTSEEIENIDTSSAEGAAVGAVRNASKYVIQTKGRATNVLNIFDKSNRSSLGNPRWWVRYDRPHGTTTWNHINISEKITKVPDPHTRISSAHMTSAKYLGKGAEKINEYAPYIAAAAIVVDTGRIAHSVHKDYQGDSWENTVKTTSSIAGGYSGGYAGAWAGASIANLVFPGLGAIVGGLAGAVVGGIYGSSFVRSKADDYYDPKPESKL